MYRSNLSEFYQRDILPKLFERLDKAFPEFHWQRTTWGWTAGVTGHGHTQPPAHCNQPWGFNDQQGNVTSWLAYLAKQTDPRGHEFVAAVKQLARLAGIPESEVNRYSSPEEINDAIDKQRERHLLESFVAHCQWQLKHSAGDHLRRALDDVGIEHRAGHCPPVGVYPTTAELGEHLVGVGFTHDEILQWALAGDPRLPGRMITAWRDQWGCIKTIVAQDFDGRSNTKRRDLFLKGGTKTMAFGLDVALRESSGGCEHLILVDGILDVVYLQSHGVSNVAAICADDQTVSSKLWEKLARQGVRTVTLAIADDSRQSTRTLESIHEVNRATQSPQVFTIETGGLTSGHTAASFVRHHGLDAFRETLKRRIHGYRFAAAHIVKKHRPSAQWDESSLTAMLGEAVAFDAEVDHRERAQDLERYFWPTILEATGLDWESLQYRLNRPVHVQPPQVERHWHEWNLKKLTLDLDQLLRAEDYQGFKRLVCAAARDFEATPQAARNAEEPVILRATWSEESSPQRREHSPRGNYSVYPLIRQHVRPEQPETEHPNHTATAADIRKLAYRLWDRHGRPSGFDEQFWFEAERTLRAKSTLTDSAADLNFSRYPAIQRAA